jgi:hypothetical protein
MLAFSALNDGVCGLCGRQGIAIVHANYNYAAIRWATDRFEWERGLKINKPDTPDAPAKFNGFGDSLYLC